MAKSLKQVLDQINKLQQQAEAIRNKEVSEVVERIRVAIEHYELTPQDLFGDKASGTSKAASNKRGRAATGKRAGVAKYASEDGRTWTGVGKRPTWFVEALASGKTAQDLLIDPSSSSASASASASASTSKSTRALASAARSDQRATRGAGQRARKTARVVTNGNGRKAVKASRAIKAAGVPKYQDGAGKTWTGVGKRPNWFVQALAAGRKAEELLIPAG